MSNKKRIIAANCFAVAAVLLTTLALAVVVAHRNSLPRVLLSSRDAEQTVHAVMQSICDGDYEKASERMLGQPSLGVNRPAEDPAAGLIWDAFAESFSYELEGGIYAVEDGLRQNVRLRALDMDSVTENLHQRTQDLLTSRVENAEDSSIFYDENDEYLDSFVQDTVYDAVEEGIREDARYEEHTLALALSYADGRWWVVADQKLLNVISGGIAG